MLAKLAASGMATAYFSPLACNSSAPKVSDKAYCQRSVQFQKQSLHCEGRCELCVPSVFVRPACSWQMPRQLSNKSYLPQACLLPPHPFPGWTLKHHAELLLLIASTAQLPTFWHAFRCMHSVCATQLKGHWPACVRHASPSGMNFMRCHNRFQGPNNFDPRTCRQM